MQFLLLIYNSESQWKSMSEAEGAKMLEEFGAFTKSIIDSGNYKGGNRLHDVARATTVRVQNGKKVVTDGPFAETKEQLAGYYILECADLDEALEWAAKIPSACGGATGCIEVRPIRQIPSPPSSGN